MIINSDTKKAPIPDDNPSQRQGEGSSSSSSSNINGIAATSSAQVAPPPTFEESAGDRALNAELAGMDEFIPPGGEAPPPEFTPYEAEYLVEDSGDIVSHDKHLNEDGEALYRFILSHAQDPPHLLVKLYGSHSETRYRDVSTTDNQGRRTYRTESYQETIVDFDFKINLSQYIANGPSPIHWSVPDEEPAYRGKMYREVDVPGLENARQQERDDEPVWGRIKAKSELIKRAKDWKGERERRGLPPWVGPHAARRLGQQQRYSDSTRTAAATGTVARMGPGGGPLGVEEHVNENAVLKSSRTLREWADEYCASQRDLKEFTYEKVIYGWNFAALEAAIIAAVKSTYYGGQIKVEFEQTHRFIHVRPDTPLSRALSKTWVKVILWILLIYPFVWLYKRYSSHGGGRWEVCGGAYPLKYWTPAPPPPPMPEPSVHMMATTSSPLVDPFSPLTPLPGFPARLPPAMMTSAGPMRLMGLKEGEWFQQWEGTIKRHVIGRLITKEPLVHSDPAQALAMGLDGYRGYMA